jgi:Co/Zn/Cd efflux system component
MVGFEVEQGERIAISSIGIDVAVPVLKRTAWFTTGSAALFFDALESSVNVVASVVALGGVHLASIPPDANHPYGQPPRPFSAMPGSCGTTCIRFACPSWASA